MNLAAVFRSVASLPATAMSASTDAAGADTAAPDDLSPLLRWIADQPDPPAVELVCAAHPSPTRGDRDTTVVRLDGCATGLSASSYLEVIASQVTALTVRADGCPAAEQVQATVAATNRLLAGCPHAPRIACRSEPAGHSRRQVYDLRRLPVSRRRLLLLSRPSLRFTPDVTADECIRTRAALRVLLGADATLGGTLPGATAPTLQELPAPSADLVANGCCTGCGVCVRSCPSSALRLERSGDEDAECFSLTFSAADCRDCGRCVALCPAGALTRAGASDWARVVDGARLPLATGQTRRCARCGDSFTVVDDAPHTRCPICEFRRSRPFGLRLPDKPVPRQFSA